MKWVWYKTIPPSSGSPFARRVWIEIIAASTIPRILKSPFARRVWIEIIVIPSASVVSLVTLRKKGVD